MSLHYSIFSPIRILLLFAVGFFTLPMVFREELMNYLAFPIFYFFGSYMVFINFPSIGKILHTKPIYINDLTIIYNNKHRDNTLKKIYMVIMNLILAILFAMFSEYIIIKGIKEKPIIEIFAIIGGNLSLYVKIQSIVGDILLKFCYKIKDTEIYRRKFSSQSISRKSLNIPKLKNPRERSLSEKHTEIKVKVQRIRSVSEDIK
jgi:DNA-directed RNA polymerase beta' subunit